MLLLCCLLACRVRFVYYLFFQFLGIGNGTFDKIVLAHGYSPVIYSNKTFTSFLSRTVPILSAQSNYLILLILWIYYFIGGSTDEYRYEFCSKLTV